ncbi:uncharacterized protein LTR77_008432 [Saxophila tyrrhenica]|uniref:Uncharacterized protein n=1 Tax=Saxophila tyrrhenica TaxID=1690608 RepID=A0AAV9P0Z6_9PEZI|nr:hypothetical protein LTR77_008432 [Saxophila tyrrhenica]
MRVFTAGTKPLPAAVEGPRGSKAAPPKRKPKKRGPKNRLTPPPKTIIRHRKGGVFRYTRPLPRPPVFPALRTVQQAQPVEQAQPRDVLAWLSEISDDDASVQTLINPPWTVAIAGDDVFGPVGEDRGLPPAAGIPWAPEPESEQVQQPAHTPPRPAPSPPQPSPKATLPPPAPKPSLLLRARESCVSAISHLMHPREHFRSGRRGGALEAKARKFERRERRALEKRQACETELERKRELMREKRKGRYFGKGVYCTEVE